MMKASSILQTCFIGSSTKSGVSYLKKYLKTNMKWQAPPYAGWEGGGGSHTRLTGHIISKSCSFSLETELTLLILASKSELS